MLGKGLIVSTITFILLCAQQLYGMMCNSSRYATVRFQNSHTEASRKMERYIKRFLNYLQYTHSTELTDFGN